MTEPVSTKSENGRRANRLIEETSPYLLQHAYNPVDWYPWGAEALGRAKSESKPILLSIGYAACHWCHVMERESFEDEHTAAYMNDHFVSIKVDREERPEIDAIYMDAVQMMTGHGGWPMTMFLTPDGKPFYGGTYFPPDERQGMPAFRRVLEAVVDAWMSRREEIERQGKQLVDRIATRSQPARSSEPLTSTLLVQGASGIGSAFDNKFGGFSGAPKFPQAPVLEFMIRSGQRSDQAKEMVEFTLTKMALGGIYDQIGGGFHRYAVDAAWLVPHFEKMLYDNAQLARVYTHAWQSWKESLYERIATETLEYLLREMRDESGAFHSSEDADSEGEEGKFYVWSHEEFMKLAPSAASYYGVTEQGNFESVNILTASGPEPPTREREALLQARTQRIRPGRDDKILTSWNGLAISALAEAGSALGRQDFVDAAEAAAGFLLEDVRSAPRIGSGIGGRLLHNHKGGRSSVLGLLEDYAYLSDGLFALWEATFEPRWSRECIGLLEQAIELFWDSDGGGFFTTGSDHEQLILRQKEIIESATPSPAAVLSLVLQKAAVLTGSADWARMGAEVLRLSRLYMERAPQAIGTHLSALDFYLSTPKEIVIIGEPGSRKDLLDRVFREFIPNRVLAGSPPGIDSPMLEGKTTSNGMATAYVCENYACQSPTTDSEELLAQLR